MYETRRLVELPARLIRRTGDVHVLAVGISEHGAFLRTRDTKVMRHELVRIAFTLDDGTELVVHGVVVHVIAHDDTHGRVPGLGISLLGLSATLSVAWRKAIERLGGVTPDTDVPHTIAHRSALSRPSMAPPS